MTETAVACRILGIRASGRAISRRRERISKRRYEIYDPERDREAKFRFGMDTGAARRIYLAHANWLLGDIGRARDLIEEVVARAAESAHVPTRPTPTFSRRMFEIFRGDAEAAQRAAETARRAQPRARARALSRQRERSASSWARARLGERETRRDGASSRLAAYTGQGNKLFVPFFQGLLAEIEAEAARREEALARIDAALALANETGERWTDAFLHRIRGEILLKRDPANTAPAEEAFLTAIAIAQQQKARSFELRAATEPGAALARSGQGQ